RENASAFRSRSCPSAYAMHGPDTVFNSLRLRAAQRCGSAAGAGGRSPLVTVGCNHGLGSHAYFKLLIQSQRCTQPFCFLCAVSRLRAAKASYEDATMLRSPFIPGDGTEYVLLIDLWACYNHRLTIQLTIEREVLVFPVLRSRVWKESLIE